MYRRMGELILSVTNQDLNRQGCLCTSTPFHVLPLLRHPLPKEPILQKHTSCKQCIVTLHRVRQNYYISIK